MQNQWLLLGVLEEAFVQHLNMKQPAAQRSARHDERKKSLGLEQRRDRGIDNQSFQ
jgi:hypothetical protein